MTGITWIINPFVHNEYLASLAEILITAPSQGILITHVPVPIKLPKY